MTEFHDTYTYTARSLDNPDKVITMTLYNHHMRVSMTGLAESVDKIIGAEEERPEVGDEIKANLQPTALKVAEKLSGPVHINDVDIDFDGENLALQAWKRAAGLRLAPVMITMGRVDNADAAEAFVDELERRQEHADSAGKFIGPLDYWFGWIALLVGVYLLLRRPQRNS